MYPDSAKASQQTAPTAARIDNPTALLSRRCHNWVRMTGDAQGQRESIIAGRMPFRRIARQQNSTDVRLGVKWSQLSPVAVTVVSFQEPTYGGL
jgi:hypothetical protein